MQLTVFRDLPSFMKVAESLLQADEPTSTMIYGVCLELQARGDFGTPEWSPEERFALTLEKAGEVLLAAVQTPPYGLIVHPKQGIGGILLDEALQALLEGWQREGLEPSNVLAPQAVAETLATSWAQRQGLTSEARLRMLLYELTEVIPPRPRLGTLLRATTQHESLVREWFYAFNREALGMDDMEAAETMARYRIPAGEIYLWHEERPLAMAARSRASETSVSVGHVYTPPELRGEGLAASCVGALSQSLLDEGFERCTLFTDLNNPVSNRVYQRLGYRPLSKFYEMIFK